MKLRNLAFSGILTLGMAACAEEEKPAAVQKIEKQEETVLGKKEDLLRRMEIYSKYKQSNDLYTYPARDDGQFTSIIYDSSGMKMHLYFDVPTGYAFIMDHLSKKQNKQPCKRSTRYFADRRKGPGRPQAKRSARPRAAKTCHTSMYSSGTSRC